MTSFDDTYLKYIDGDTNWGEGSSLEQTQTKEYGRGEHKHTLPRYVFCWVCMEEVNREEIGRHYKSQSHKHHRSEILREVRAYRDKCEVSGKLCGACPALVGDDYTVICRYGWFRYYDNRWYRNLFGYYNSKTGQIDEMYPLDARESNLDWEIVALRPDACKRQLGGKITIPPPEPEVLRVINNGLQPTIQDDFFE